MEHIILETNPSNIGDRSNNHKKKKRKTPVSERGPKDISLQKKSCIEGKENDKAWSIPADGEAADGKVTGYSNSVGNSYISCASEDRKSDIACQSLKTEAASSISNQSQDTVEKKRKRPRKRMKSMLNACGTCETNGISAKDLGGDLSLSGASDKSYQAVVDVSKPQSKEVEKTGSFHLQTLPAIGIVTDRINNGVSQDKELNPSMICDESMAPEAKKKRKQKKSKKIIMDSIPNDDSNCDPAGKFSSAGGIQSAVSNQIVESSSSMICDKSMEPKAKKKSMRKGSKKTMGSVSNADSNRDPDGGTLTIGIASDNLNNLVSEKIETAPSTICDQSKEQKAKKIKKKTKSKKKSVLVSNADSNRDPDGGTLTIGIASDNLNNLVSEKIETAPSTICDQSKEQKAKKIKKKTKSKKKSVLVSNSDSKTDPDGISPTSPSLSLVATAVGCSSRKLLILDLNGLLADIRSEEVKGYMPLPYKWLAYKAVYKRPFCDDFVQFCFENFDVGVWTSRKRKSVEPILPFLIKNDKKKKLLFSWNQSHCTKTGYKSMENKDKPIFLKELQKLWNKELRGLPSDWEKAGYNESNTLLLDDSPYKALRNPPYTGIFPKTYECSDIEDNSLGPDGDLRLYLKRLAAAENVQEFVKENPFGQTPITNSHPSWNFYSKIFVPTHKYGRTKWSTRNTVTCYRNKAGLGCST